MPEIGPAAKRVGRHRTRSRSAWLTVCCKEKFSTSLTGNVWAQMPRPAKVRLVRIPPSPPDVINCLSAFKVSAVCCTCGVRYLQLLKWLTEAHPQLPRLPKSPDRGLAG